MAEISAAAVKALRDLTDLPMMLCKQALVEASGDQKQAIEILKREVGKVREKRAANATLEGRMFTLVKQDGSEAVMVEVQCESEPVARGQDIEKFGTLLAQQLLEGPGAQSPEDLLKQQIPGEPSRTLQDMFDDLVAKIREKIVVHRVARVKGPVGAYVHHDGKTGVLFQASGENKQAPVLRDVAMHIAGLKPKVVSPDQLDPAAIKAERERLAADAKKTGKPDNIIEKIVDGKMNMFYKEEGVLGLQDFAKEQSKSVNQALAEQGLKPVAFIHWIIGQ
jgi:elongation factor Ts